MYGFDPCNFRKWFYSLNGKTLSYELRDVKVRILLESQNRGLSIVVLQRFAKPFDVYSSRGFESHILYYLEK